MVSIINHNSMYVHTWQAAVRLHGIAHMGYTYTWAVGHVVSIINRNSMHVHTYLASSRPLAWHMGGRARGPGHTSDRL